MSDASTSQGGARPILRGQGMVRVYPDGDVQALRGVSLAVEQGESVVISAGKRPGLVGPGRGEAL